MWFLTYGESGEGPYGVEDCTVESTGLAAGDFLSEICADASSAPGSAIRKYTEAPIRQGRLDSPWLGVVGGVVPGEIDYAKGLLAKAKVDLEEQTDARALERAGRVSWEKLVESAEEERGVKWEDALERHGDWTRDAILYLATHEAGKACRRWLGGYRGSSIKRQRWE
ncbi:MAG: hypothetical protein IT581_02225 [Verrucomicrobiales bacterium]|nr:hypothetical protein [Verrucomicrobiales bacterium]